APHALSTLSLHDALPIFSSRRRLPRKEEEAARRPVGRPARAGGRLLPDTGAGGGLPRELARRAPGPRLGGAEGFRGGERPALLRSEEHTSELQSLAYLVC